MTFASPTVFNNPAIVMPVPTRATRINLSAASRPPASIRAVNRTVFAHVIQSNFDAHRIADLGIWRFRYMSVAALAFVTAVLAVIVSTPIAGIGPLAIGIGLLGNVIVLQMKLSDARKTKNTITKA